MRTLLITHEHPLSGYGGGQRVLSLKRAFGSLGECRVLGLVPRGRNSHPPEVDYVCASDLAHDGDAAYWRMRRLLFSDYRPFRPAVAYVEEIRRQFHFDVVVCHMLAASRAAPVHLAPCFLDCDMLEPPSGLLQRLWWPATRRMLDRRAAEFSRVFVIRPSDLKYFQRAKTSYLPCISTAPGAPAQVRDDARNLLFVGSPKIWEPNQEAIEYLVEKLAPRLDGGGFRIRLVGEGTEEYDGRNGVSGAGFVDNLDAEYRDAALVLCPIWTGHGANVKLAEALQYGAAVIATRHAAAGFDGVARPDAHRLACGDRDEFTECVLRTLSSSDQISALRRNARMLGDTLLSQKNLNKIVAAAVGYSANGAHIRSAPADQDCAASA